ncbi:MAG: hypothetical protein M3252_08140 [Actinomycetota bacterium]|nr:hypothetical protein [Actinomycetota bacterium]
MPEDHGDTLVLDDEERELVQLELAALLPALTGERRRRYEQLGEAVTEGSIPAQSVPLLESLLELALQTARARQLYRAEGERILTGLFRRTPRGRELTELLDQVNRALVALRGSTLSRAHIAMRTLGHFTLTIETDAATITLGVRPDSVNVESVAVGGSQGPAG